MKFQFKEQPAWLSYGIVVIALHIIGIALLLINAHRYPQIIGFGFLAYTLGLRHAFDVDHIAAIDNTVRKLVQDKEDPAGVGFFFSIGHSTVVFVMAVITAFSIKWAQNNIPQIKEIGSLIGTTVSGIFLVLIGVLNLYIWFDIYKIFIGTRRGEYNEENLDKLLLNRGFISRLLGSFYRFINKSWHVYPLGFLFGLGFDTASEVALFAVSANAATQYVPITFIISLPIIFAAGMSLMDTADGIFMTTAYNWAFSTPIRKIYYNLSVTGISVVAALFIGFIELAQILTPKLGLNSGFWRWIQNLNFGSMGYLLVGLFIISWGISYLAWKMLRLETV
ncbi:HoxN/HupN/NixA family nickel/cobalt transporter [Clostridium magnum]|uniref:Nickel/cobalt efflux system n=1 Tax=Clostridium magnum DSM 2767 TaxID=1121326 RepID=A0A162TQI2_9CLOT|nr:HoxN/HupN/NixA family nickel/cobalt transporter [Clostridium magnum]KZL92923.1 high-affinity nickel-transport protein NixA [Clostridium magnum DSM 2767]SHJ16421.1 high-affinity nickel-transport protein [Clostridium magnum DSM 2767]